MDDIERKKYVGVIDDFIGCGESLDSAFAEPAFAYIYNTSAQVVSLESDVTFSNNGVITNNITHTLGTSSIVLGSAGYYEISFLIAAVELNQFTLFKNGVSVVGSTYGSGDTNQPNPAAVIIRAAAGDVITVRNHTSAAAVTLQTLAGGTQTCTNASVFIQKLLI